MDEKLNALLEYVKSDGRICPIRICWDQLWEMLPDKTHIGRDWIPPLPLTLVVWWETPLSAKTLRLDNHIHYAAEHGVLDKVDTYLRGLKTEEWFYGK